MHVCSRYDSASSEVNHAEVLTGSWDVEGDYCALAVKKKEYQKDENTLVSLAHLFKDFEVSVNIFYEPKSALIGPEQSVFFISNVQW